MRQAELKRRMMLEQKDGAISRGLHNCPQERRFAHSVNDRQCRALPRAVA
jgi:hypothetical protein